MKIMKENDKATYTLWIGSHLAATRSHTTENYIDLLGIASETLDKHVTIYSSREDVPVYDSNDESNMIDTTIVTAEDIATMDAIYNEMEEAPITSYDYE
jgi:hypothetical protein